jgi:hypothetical protein
MRTAGQPAGFAGQAPYFFPPGGLVIPYLQSGGTDKNPVKENKPEERKITAANLFLSGWPPKRTDAVFRK